MKKSHIYIAIIILLSILNIAQLVEHFSDQKPKGKVFFDQLAAKNMNMDEEQKVKFAKLTGKHKKEIDNLQKQQKEWIAAYFKQPNDSIMIKISKLEQAKIQTTLTHFAEVKSILKPSQYSDFKQFKSGAVNHILGKSGSKKPAIKK